MKKQLISKLTVLALVATIGTSTLSPSISVSANTNVIEVQQSIEGTEIKEGVETRGIKKWISKKILKSTAKLLRSGGSIVRKVAKELGGREANYFLKNVNVIADALDSLTYASDFVEDKVIDTIASALIGARVPAGVARTIANVFTFFIF